MPTRVAALLLAAGLLAAAAHAQDVTGTVVTQDQPRLMLRPYQVADLVIPIGAGKAIKTDEARLIKLIQDTVAPKSWAATGGKGTIDYHPQSMSLVINQTPDVQEQIAGLLATLRREQDTQASLEVRVVAVPEAFFERAGVELNGNAERSALLNGKQLAQLLETVQGDQRANVMQAPKVTMLNGQTAIVNCTEKEASVTAPEVIRRGQPVPAPKKEDVATGFRMSARPVVSADHRYVQVALQLDLQQPKVNALHIDKTLTIPDGGTVLFGGVKKVTENRTEVATPVLSKLPYVSRLFTNVGYAREAQNVYVLVTPRVICTEEEECRPAGCSRCTDVVRTRAASAEESEPCASVCRQGKALAELLKAYDEACAAGHKDEAAKLAQAALILDPTCFAKGHGR
jgi:type II secretory pathway component GspD/PulD (secretin)